MQAPIALIRWLAAISALSAAPAAGGAAAASFADSFAGGSTQLDWQSFPMFGGGQLEAMVSKEAPDGDGGIGVLRHDGGGLATVSYANTPKAEDDFTLTAWIQCPSEAGGRDGSLTGLAFYLQTARGGDDPEEGGFYRLVCDYRLGSGSFSLAYLGANIGRQPLELERWPLAEQVAPTAGGGWRQVEVKVDQGLIELFLDGLKLNERPLPAERVITDIANVDAGWAGVYAGHIGEEGAAEARVDGFTFRIR